MRPESDGAARLGRSKLAPNLFDAAEETDQQQATGEIVTTAAEKPADQSSPAGEQSIRISDFDDEGEESAPRFDLFRFFRKSTKVR
jgi:hypothetical protein